MPTVKLLTATHIHALPGVHSVSDAECARLCALGVAEPVVSEPVVAEPAEPTEKAEPKKNTRKKAVK